MNVSIYGESYLSINKGTISKQKITAYGASNIIEADVNCKEAKITAYGDGTYQLKASEKVKVSSYGEAKITYKGNAKLKKGIIIGESEIINVQ